MPVRPCIASGAPDGATYFFFGDEQGGIVYSKRRRKLKPGDVVTCVVPHCDPTVNLYDVYHVRARRHARSNLADRGARAFGVIGIMPQ